jgi:hypothetical protein
MTECNEQPVINWVAIRAYRRFRAVGVASKAGRRLRARHPVMCGLLLRQVADFLGPGGWSGPGTDPRRGLMLALPGSPLPAYDYG